MEKWRLSAMGYVLEKAEHGGAPGEALGRQSMVVWYEEDEEEEEG